MNNKNKMKRLDKELLPSPEAMLRRLGLRFNKANFKGYLKLHCPFHKDGNERNPSLNLHQMSGHYRCHACGAKGGNILAFYMTLTGVSFKVAVNDLCTKGNRR